MTVSLSFIDPGTIGDYSDLEEKIAAWLDRDDLTPRIPDFIALLESRLNRLLRTVNQETKTIWVISDEAYALPADFRKLRKIHIEGSPDRPLAEVSPTAVPARYNGEAGTPQAYWVEGRVLSLAPPPNEATTFRVTYYLRIPPLTISAPVNWLLTEHPDIYLWGGLHQAATYIRDADAIALTKQYLDDAIAELQRESRLDSWGGGPLVPMAVRQVRGGRC